MAELLKGAPVAVRLTEEAASRSAALSARGVVPTLCLIRVGERADDLSCERGLLKRAASAGVDVRKVVLDATCSQGELMAAVASANADPAVHGILMFRTCPPRSKRRPPARPSLPRRTSTASPRHRSPACSLARARATPRARRARSCTCWTPPACRSRGLA